MVRRAATAPDLESSSRHKIVNIGKRVCDSLEQVRSMAQRVIDEFDNEDGDHAIPIWPLSDDDSIITTVTQMIHRQKTITKPPPSSPTIQIPDLTKDKTP